MCLKWPSELSLRAQWSWDPHADSVIYGPWSCVHHLSFLCKLTVKHFSDVPCWCNRKNIYNSRHQHFFLINDMKLCLKRLWLCKLFHSCYHFILKVFSGHCSSSKWRNNTLKEDKNFCVISIVFFFLSRNEQSSDRNRKMNTLMKEAGHFLCRVFR